MYGHGQSLWALSLVGRLQTNVSSFFPVFVCVCELMDVVGYYFRCLTLNKTFPEMDMEEISCALYV